MRSLVALNPMPSRLPLTQSEEARVIAALPQFSSRDRTFVLLSLNTGYRVAEILSLTVGQVWNGLEPATEVTVARRDLKGGRGPRQRRVRSRSIPLNAAARAAIQNHIATLAAKGTLVHPAAPLFPSLRKGRALCRWQANRIVHRVTAAAGLAGQSRYGTHTLRKSYCRKVYEASRFDINLTRAAMGHASIATTQKYLEVDEDRVRDLVLAI